MKAFSVLSLALLADAATIGNVEFQKRQFGGDLLGFGNKAKPIDPIRVKKLEPTFGGGAVREELLFGPFKLTASNATHASGFFKLDATSDIIATRIKGLCKECMVLKARSDVAKADGSKADIGSAGLYSHHILMTAMGRAMAPMPVVPGKCANGKQGGFNFETLLPSKGMGKKGGASGGMSHGHGGMKKKRQFQLPAGLDIATVMKFLPKFSVFMGQGDEGSGLVYADPTNQIKSGFYLGKDIDMNMMGEVINYDTFDKDVYFIVDYEYLPNMPVEPKDYYDVGMGAINVDPCGSGALFPSADKPVKYTSPPWDVIMDGYLLDVKPHLHDGGVNMTFYVNDKLGCTSRAIYGGDAGSTQIGGEKWETITAYESCKDPVAIKKGDKLTMEAWYDLTAHRLRPMNTDHEDDVAEGMALALFVAAVKTK